MPEKEVLLECYDASENLLATSSAILFDGNVVLLYGCGLAPILNTKLKRWLLSTVAGVDSEIRPNPVIDKKIQFVVYDEDEDEDESVIPEGVVRSGRRMVSAGMWMCPLLKSTLTSIEKAKNEKTNFSSGKASESAHMIHLSSLFIFLESPQPANAPRGLFAKIFNIVDKLSEPSRGQNVIVQFTPFLKSNFINSISRGVVSSVIGRHGCMFLTDAVGTAYSVGAPVFLADDARVETNGKGSLLGLIGLLNEIDLTLCVSLLPVLWRLLPPRREIGNYPRTSPRPNSRTLVDETIVSVSCTNFRSSGIVVDAESGIIVTCSHGIPQETRYIHVFHKGNIYPATLVYKTLDNSPCDLAVLKVASSGCFRMQMELAETPARIGEKVYAVGFPFFYFMEDATVVPLMSSGCVAKCYPSFILTTCSVFPGQSGGAVVRNGQLLGVICSYFCKEIKDSSERKNHFRNCFALARSAFADHLKKYIETGDVDHLKNMESSTVAVPLPAVMSNM